MNSLFKNNTIFLSYSYRWKNAPTVKINLIDKGVGNFECDSTIERAYFTLQWIIKSINAYLRGIKCHLILFYCYRWSKSAKNKIENHCRSISRKHL